MTNVMKYPLRALSALGLYSQTNQKKVLIATAVHVTIVMTIVAIAITQLMLSTNTDVFQFVGTLETVSSYVQIVGKAIGFAYKYQQIHRLIRYRDYFWKTDICEENTAASHEKLLQFVFKLQLFYFGSIVVSVTFMGGSALLTKQLPLGTWYIEGYENLYRTILSLEILSLPGITLFFFAFDGIFMAFSTEIIVQFRILSYKFKQLYTDTLTEKCKHESSFIVLIRQHVFLIHKEASSIVHHGCMCLTLIFQLAFFCIPADYTVSEATLVADAIYGSNWHSADDSPPTRKLLPMVILASQTQASFRAAGLFEVNSRLVVTVLKVCWSSCTIMRALKMKST